MSVQRHAGKLGQGERVSEDERSRMRGFFGGCALGLGFVLVMFQWGGGPRSLEWDSSFFYAGLALWREYALACGPV